jgi:hypothetical protein
MSITTTDSWASFAPYLANVVCCPQFDATVVIIIGQSTKYSKSLALNKTHAKHFLRDVEKILESLGANENLQKICSFHPENFTEFSCPFTDVNEFDCLSTLRTFQDLWLLVEGLILSMSVVTKFAKMLYKMLLEKLP